MTDSVTPKRSKPIVENFVAERVAMAVIRDEGGGIVDVRAMWRGESEAEVFVGEGVEMWEKLEGIGSEGEWGEWWLA